MADWAVMRMGRAGALLVACAVLATACGPDGQAPQSLEEAVDGVADAVEDAARRDVESGTPESTEQPTVDGEAPAEDGPAAPGDAGTAPQGSGEPAQGPGDRGTAGGDRTAGASLADDRGPVGSMCRDYLRQRVPRLVVEIDHQAGAGLSRGAVDHLASVLRRVVDKPGGVVVRGGSPIPGGPRTWTADDLRQTAEAHRDHYSAPEQAVMYVLSVRGESHDDAIGLAFHGTEFAVFPDEFGGLDALTGGREAIERAVLAHEAGHLLCLVNIGYTSQAGHADPEHPHHSRDRDSVMHWAVETSAVSRVFSGPPPDDFTATDRADLDGLRSGRY